MRMQFFDWAEKEILIKIKTATQELSELVRTFSEKQEELKKLQGDVQTRQLLVDWFPDDPTLKERFKCAQEQFNQVEAQYNIALKSKFLKHTDIQRDLAVFNKLKQLLKESIIRQDINSITSWVLKRLDSFDEVEKGSIIQLLNNWRARHGEGSVDITAPSPTGDDDNSSHVISTFLSGLEAQRRVTSRSDDSANDRAIGTGAGAGHKP